MPRPYPAEFRARAITLVRTGKPPEVTADDLGTTPRQRALEVTLSKDSFIHQAPIAPGD